MKIGVIGLGAMGGPMAVNFASANKLHLIWNRSQEKAIALSAEIGVPVADNLEQMAQECDILVTCVSTDDDVLQVLEQLKPGLSAGKIVVDTSTIAPKSAVQANASLAQISVEFLDAPVSGGVEGAKNAQLVMMIGGDYNAFEKVKPFLEIISKKQIYMGEAGCGQACKAVNQLMAAGINQAVSESLAFSQALGLDQIKVIEALSSGAAANWFLANRGPTMCNNSFAPGFRLALHYKDLNICRELAESCTNSETRLPVLEMTLIHYQRLINQQLGDNDISVLYKLKTGLFKASNEN